MIKYTPTGVADYQISGPLKSGVEVAPSGHVTAPPCQHFSKELTNVSQRGI